MRLPWTIWRYASSELWRLVLLTTAVVVLVVAFAATVKPMAEGKIGAGAAARFLLFAIPVMLQYVLPFAAGFGSTLAFHRMASDNELDAARVGGIGYRALLAPAASAGLVLAAALGVLTAEIVPRFIRSMDEIVAQDLTQMLVNAVERGESVRFDDILVYADHAVSLGPDEKSGAYDVLVLSRFAALGLEKSGEAKGGEVKGGVTAARAWIWLRRAADAAAGGEAYTLATIKLERAHGDVPGEFRGSGDPIISRRLPTPFRDDVKFMTWDELRRLPKNPDEHASVDSRRRALAYAMARADAINAIDAELRSQRRARLLGGGREVVIRSAGLALHERGRVVDGENTVEQRWVLTPVAPGGSIEIEVIDNPPPPPPTPPSGEAAESPTPERVQGGSLRRLIAAAAHLASGAEDPLRPGPSLTLHLAGVRVQGAGGETPTEDPSRDYRGLGPAVDAAAPLLAMPSRDLLPEAARRLEARPDPGVAGAADKLRRRLEHLDREILGRTHERAAMSLSCLVMVLTGCVTAIRLRDRLPVPVYLWSFFPGIGAVLTVNAGKEMVHWAGAPGLILLWGGLLALALYTAAVYWVIRKH